MNTLQKIGNNLQLGVMWENITNEFNKRSKGQLKNRKQLRNMYRNIRLNLDFVSSNDFQLDSENIKQYSNDFLFK